MINMYFILITMSCIVAVTLLYNAEKCNDYVEKFWCLTIGVIFVWLTIFMVKKSMTETNSFESQQIEHYNNFY